MPGGQPSTPNLTPPSQIDPSSIERAYAALGLTYQGNQMPQQPPQSNLPNQPGMRSLNAMGEWAWTRQNSVGEEEEESRKMNNNHGQCSKLLSLVVD